MTTRDPAHPIRKAPLFTPYVVVWTMFGTLSLGILGVLGLAPEWLEDLRPAGMTASPQSNQGQRISARLAADITTLKDSVAQIQLELAKVKTEVATQGEQHKSVTAQVTALETRVAPLPVAKAEAAAAQPQTAPQAAAPQTTEIPPLQAAATAQTAPADPVKAPARAAKVINAETVAAGTTLETGSVAGQAVAGQVKASADAIAFGPAVVKPAPKPVGVKISSGASVDSLRLSWSLLAEKHATALKALEPRYTTAGDPANPTYDLVAGPLKSKTEAARVCKALAAQGVPCTVGAYVGDVL